MSEVLTREIDELRLLMGSPRDPHGRVFAQLGDALRRAGSHREALSVLLDGVAEHPNFTPGHLVLGWTAQEAGDLEVARSAYERTVELDPENPKGLFGLGTLLERDGNPEGASLIAEAEALDEGVRDSAPGFPGPRAVADADDSFAVLPFVPLAELAPDEVVEGAAATDAETGLDDLPFMTLEELAPDAPPTAEGELAADFDELPFISLEDLRPDEVADVDAAAQPEAGVEAELHTEAESDAEADAHTEAELHAEDGEDEADAPFHAEFEGRDVAEAAEPERGVVEGGAADGEVESHDRDEEAEVLAGPLATRTMGELLVRQGLTAEAVEVFETLVARSPDDVGLQERLAELKGELVPTSVDEADDSQEPDEVSAHPSMDPPVPHPEVPSPFHLGQSDVEEAAEEDGEVVGDYFARLLAWSPPRRDVEGEPPATLEGEEPSSS